jgi:hypothetical protein
MKKIVRLTERDLSKLVKRVIKEQDEFGGMSNPRKPTIDKHISNRLNSFLQTAVSHVGREETAKFLEKVASKLMDYEYKDVESDYSVNFDWIEDLAREMGDSDEILMKKNQEKNYYSR